MYPTMIQFMNPTFPEVGQVFVTCRKGHKWSAIGMAPLGSTLYMVEAGKCEVLLGSAEVLASFCCRLRDIPASWLAREHDEKCRDHAGLLAEMRRIYGQYEDDYTTSALLLLRTR